MHTSRPFRSLFVHIAATAATVATLFVAQHDAHAQDAPAIPHLQRQGAATQLIVHGKPFLMLGGELGNSSASDAKYMEAVWPKLKAMHLNTVLMPVYWELIEPNEGVYDFALVDGLIAEARTNDIKIVILWFGTWKNSMSCYAPLWVKTDQKRFPRARTSNGGAIEIMTPISTENRDADALGVRGVQCRPPRR